jgi:ABC-type transport system substrate-binding protein
MILNKVKFFFLIVLLNLLLAACGGAGLEPTPAPTATPRPTPVLATPTELPVSPSATPTSEIAATAKPSTQSGGRTATATATRRGTVNPTRNPLTATVDTSLTPTPVVIGSPAVTATPRSVRAIGGDLISAVDREPTTFQPYGPADPISQQYRALLYDAKLLKRNPQTLDWESHAAQAFKYDPATKTVAFSLRHDLKWSDGKPITSADYVWTYSQALDPGKSWTGAALYTATIESYIAPDSYTIVVKLREQTSDPVELANFVEPLPKHIWDGQSWSEPDRNKEILEPSVISGPWKFKEWVKKDRVVFERNEASSVTPPPYLHSLTFLYVPDSRKGVEMLSRGEIDFYVPPADRYSEMNNLAKVIVYRWNPATPEWNFLGFNFRQKLPSDPAFRRALASITDRNEIIKGPGEGRGTPQYSDVPPGHPAYTDEVEKYDGGLEKGKLFLKQAGYNWRESDGRLLDPQGNETPELTLLYNQEGQTRGRLAAYFQQKLGMLGVAVRLVAVDYLSYLNRLKQPPYDYDLFLGGWKPDSPDMARFGQNWKNSFTGYNNPELTTLYQKAAHEPDKAAQKQLLTQIQQLEARELPYLYLYAEQGYLGALLPVGGIEESHLGPDAEGYTNWYIKP